MTSFREEELDAQATYYYEIEALEEEGNASSRASMVDLTTSGVDAPKNMTHSPTSPSSLAENPVVTIS